MNAFAGDHAGVVLMGEEEDLFFRGGKVNQNGFLLNNLRLKIYLPNESK